MIAVMRRFVLISVFFVAVLSGLQAADSPWPKDVKSILAEARGSIPCVQEFRQLYPEATMEFAYPVWKSGMDKDALETRHLRVSIGLYRRFILTMSVPFKLTANREGIASFEEPSFEVEEITEITGSENERSFITRVTLKKPFAEKEFKVLQEHAGDLTALGFDLSRDKALPYFERAWKPGRRASFTPRSTFSPNRRYGVSVPIFQMSGDDGEEERNKVVDVRTGRVVAVIHADPGYDRALNHRQVGFARWSEDESVLLWEVDGKWTPDAFVVLKLRRGGEVWQLDLLKTAQQAILIRTRKAAPKAYAAAKEAHAGSGSAYPEGFTVDVSTADEDSTAISLPLRVHVNLTADPRLMVESPRVLQSWLDGIVTEDGNFSVTNFHLGLRKGYEGR